MKQGQKMENSELKCSTIFQEQITMNNKTIAASSGVSQMSLIDQNNPKIPTGSAIGKHHFIRFQRVCH